MPALSFREARASRKKWPRSLKKFNASTRGWKTWRDCEEPGKTGNISAQQLLQGPLADVMTHAGQLALLRRLAGSPVPPENFIRAAIGAENLGPNQPEPVAPDPGWSPDLPPQAPGKGLPEDW